MKDKNIDRITPFLPFVLIFAAAVIGMTSEIDLFSLSKSNDFSFRQKCLIKKVNV